jgi:hypothetical protein
VDREETFSGVINHVETGSSEDSRNFHVSSSTIRARRKCKTFNKTGQQQFIGPAKRAFFYVFCHKSGCLIEPGPADVRFYYWCCPVQLIRDCRAETESGRIFADAGGRIREYSAGLGFL